MSLIGCDAPGRNIEQHDIFFGIGHELKDLVPQIKSFWPEAIKPHLDAWREVTNVDGYSITINEKNIEPGNPTRHSPLATPLSPLASPLSPLATSHSPLPRLFFLNLGGYKKDEFEEYHYRMLAIATDKGQAINKAKETAFFKHTGFKGATSHVDDKYGVDVDGVVEIKDILSKDLRDRFGIRIEKVTEEMREDKVNLGYFLLEKL